ncbi:MAG TPA: DUF4380 domain-containing protein [Polyangiaceae bacterium]|jgi:hypothetical protein
MRAAAALLAAVAIFMGGCHKEEVPVVRMPTETKTPGTEPIQALRAPRDPAVRSVARGKNYGLEFGPYSVEVDPTDGGRIVSFALSGRSVVLSRDESPEAYGSSLWPSPQSDWSWPPPPALDKGEWKATQEDGALVFESKVDDKLALSVRQRITADVASGALDIEYTLSNRGGTARRVAPWQNTRVRPGGITLYPSTTATSPQSTLKLAPQDGIVWYVHVPSAVHESGKSFGDGTEGWLAQVDGDLLFVKVFPDVPPGAQAPGEGEIEIYVHESGRFVEMEQQGPYVEIPPGGASTWKVRWLVRQLPREVAAEGRGRKLVDFVRGVVAASR